MRRVKLPLSSDSNTWIQVADVAWNGKAQATTVLGELDAELVVIVRFLEL